MPRSVLLLVQGDKEICATQTKTDARGEVAAQLNLPPGEFHRARLEVSVQCRTARDTVEEPVNVHSAVRTLLTTDDLQLNGKAVKTLRVDQSNSDVLQLVDLKEMTVAGPNDVSLEFEGTGGLLYQVVGRYYLPYPRGAGRGAEDEPLGIQVQYDRTNLDAEDVVGVTATVTNNRAGSAQMVIVDLGLPPGFTPVLDMLNRLVAEKQIEKYSVTGRQIIVYLRQVTGGPAGAVAVPVAGEVSAEGPDRQVGGLRILQPGRPRRVQAGATDGGGQEVRQVPRRESGAWPENLGPLTPAFGAPGRRCD